MRQTERFGGKPSLVNNKQEETDYKTQKKTRFQTKPLLFHDDKWEMVKGI